MNGFNLDINNEHRQYLDEKELFILYCLSKDKHISTLWSGVFVPNPREQIIGPDTTPEELLSGITYRGQSVIVLNYLFNLGKTFDEDGFSVYCNADYALVEGGFLTNDFHKEMSAYLRLPEADRKKDTILSREQKDFLEEIISGKKDLADIKVSVQFTKLANPPTECYREAILNKKADKNFIELVNKLVTDYDGGRWDTQEVKEFLELWYANNKKIKISPEDGIFYESHQKKLARQIFENIDIHLNIKDTKKIEAFLNKYIDLFQNNKLDGTSKNGLTRSFFSSGLSLKLHTKPFGFARQKDILLKHIEDNYTEYKRNDLEIGNPFVEPEYIGDNQSNQIELKVKEENKERDLFLFVHTMISLERDGYFRIKKFSFGTKEMFDLYDRGFLFEIEVNEDTFSEDIKQKTSSSFDPDKSRLYVHGKEIKVKKFGDEYHTLRVIFEDPEDLSKEWFFSEIREKIDESILDDKKYYNAIYQLKLKLGKQGINDFFISTKQSVKINRKYLS